MPTDRAWTEYQDARNQLDIAEKEHLKMLRRFFPTTRMEPGKRIQTGEEITSEIWNEIQEVWQRFGDTRKRLMEARKRLQD